MSKLLVAALVLIAACGNVKGEGSPSPSLSHTSPPGLTPGPNAVPWRVPNGITACGVLRTYAPATSTDPGTLAIGSRSFTIAPGTARAGTSGFVPEAGKAMCVWGGLSGTAASSPNSDLLGPYRCGRVRDYLAPTSAASGRLRVLEYWSQGEVELSVPSAASLGALRFDDYRCFAVEVDASGDVLAAARDLRLANETLACGRLRAYTPATATVPGSISIGSRTFGLPAGVTYTPDPAGARTDTQRVGQVICLRAIRDDAGVIASYGPDSDLGEPAPTGALTGGMCGRIAAFVAPTASSDGLVALALNIVPFRIPAGTQLTQKAGDAYRCYDLALDAQGDVIAVHDKDQPPVGF